MKKICKLSELPLMTTAVVIRLDTDSPLTRRIVDLGLSEGAAVTPVFKSPFGDPTAYSVKDCLIALRKSDCRSVLVEIRGDRDE